MAAESVVPAPVQPAPAAGLGGSDRRADVDAKQALVARLLQEVGCDGLLLLEPENFAWITSGAAARSVLETDSLPAIYANAEQRWLVASNVDSQRLFDEELDGLGFQLKEWPWYWGREQLLADLCHNRKVASDVTLPGCLLISDRLRSLRRQLTLYEQACCLALGPTVSQALEATCRAINPGETERDVAGQISQRLISRGAWPLAIEVAADGRSRSYRRCGFTSLPIQHYCVVGATARKYGLCVSASRAVGFGELDSHFRREHDIACKVAATYIACSWPDAVPEHILTTGRHVYQITNLEHEWRLAPQGHVTGRSPVELAFLPRTQDLLQPDWAVTWQASAGAALSADTILVRNQGPHLATPTDAWPLKLIRVQGAEFVRPDVLRR